MGLMGLLLGLEDVSPSTGCLINSLMPGIVLIFDIGQFVISFESTLFQCINHKCPLESEQ